MSLLLVDDRDGRIVAELQGEDEALRVLRTMASGDGGVPEWLCLVAVRSNQGSVVETDTSVKIRTLL